MATLEHGKPGHVNIYVLDHDSDITGYGAHERCLPFGSPDGTRVTVRVDYRHGLPNPTEAQIRKVAMGSHRIHGRGTLHYLGASDQYRSGNGEWESVDHEYEVRK